MFRQFLALAVFLSSATFATFSAVAVEPSERLLPLTTKGFLSVPDIDRLRLDWNKTQLGQLMNDPTMAPFVEDIKRQIRTKLSKTDSRLRISWQELENVYGGEVCVAVTQPWDFAAEDKRVAAAVALDVTAARKRGDDQEKMAAVREKAERNARQTETKKRQQSHGLILLVDVTGHLVEARELLDKIAAQLAEDGDVAKPVSIAGIDAETHTIKNENGATHRVLYCIHENQLVATDSVADANELLARLGGKQHPSLADTAAFQATMERSKSGFGEESPHIRWFVEPFGYIEVSRVYDGGRRRRGTDILQVLANQGFDAVQGIGGHIGFSTADLEILHQTFVYAPPVESQDGQQLASDSKANKYRLAANILDFPNRAPQPHGDWIPSTLSSYLTFNWNIRGAFDHIGSLVDEFAGDEVFDEVIRSIELDPTGPQIDIRKELINHLSDRVTVVSDYRAPITPKSERLLLAIELANPVAVANTVNKAMESDPGARLRVHHGHDIWEILNEAAPEVQAVQIEGFGFFDEPELVEEPEKPLIPNSAVTVAFGQLLIATHVDYITEILDATAAGERLDTAPDYIAVDKALVRLGLALDSFRSFTRTDEAYRPTYELMKQGKMPEAETVLGKVLNALWEPAEEGKLRAQYVDGDKMPEFSQVEKYFGPGGFFVHSKDDGWSIVGCILEKTVTE